MAHEHTSSLFEACLVSIVKQPRKALVNSNVRSSVPNPLAVLPPDLAELVFDALYRHSKLTPRIVETFLELGYDDLVAEREIHLVRGKPWCPPLSREDYKNKKPF